MAVQWAAAVGAPVAEFGGLMSGDTPGVIAPNVTLPLVTAVPGGSQASLHVYYPTGKKPNIYQTLMAVMVVPGGSYRSGPFGWCKKAEGSDIAEWLAHEGIIGAVLHYRMPGIGHYDRPMADIMQGMSALRRHLHEYKQVIQSSRPEAVGVLGFSAGGHLAALAATKFTSASNRPDFAMLIYPLISMVNTYTHANSKRELLGPEPSAALVRNFSAEKQVRVQTPMTILISADDDHVVPPINSKLYLDACQGKGVFCTSVSLAKGGHPFVNKPKVWPTAKTALWIWITWWDAYYAATAANSSASNRVGNLTAYFYDARRRSPQLMTQSLRRMPDVSRVLEVNAPRMPRIRGGEPEAPAILRPSRPPPWVKETWGDVSWDEKTHENDWRVLGASKVEKALL